MRISLGEDYHPNPSYYWTFVKGLEVLVDKTLESDWGAWIVLEPGRSVSIMTRHRKYEYNRDNDWVWRGSKEFVVARLEAEMHPDWDLDCTARALQHYLEERLKDNPRLQPLQLTYAGKAIDTLDVSIQPQLHPAYRFVYSNTANNYSEEANLVLIKLANTSIALLTWSTMTPMLKVQHQDHSVLGAGDRNYYPFCGSCFEYGIAKEVTEACKTAGVTTVFCHAPFRGIESTDALRFISTWDELKSLVAEQLGDTQVLDWCEPFGTH